MPAPWFTVARSGRDRTRWRTLDSNEGLIAGIATGSRGGLGSVKGSIWHGRNATLSSVANDTVSNQRRLPDPEICRTRHLGPSLDLSKCLVENSNGCVYAVRYGSGVYCHHHDRRGFERKDRL